MDTQLKNYQLTALLSPLLDERGVSDLKQKIKNWIEEKQGQIKEEKITKKNLSYQIQKFRGASYFTLNFLSDSSNIETLNSQLPSEKDILRHLIIKCSKVRPKQFSSRISAPRIERALEKLVDKKIPMAPKPMSEKPEKVKIEDLDKRLEEILKE